MKRDKSPSEALLRRRAFYLHLPQQTLRTILNRKGVTSGSQDAGGPQRKPKEDPKLVSPGEFSPET